MIIADPLNKFNNIGKSSYNFTGIQEELRAVYTRLSEELVRFVKFVARGAPSTSQSLPANKQAEGPQISQQLGAGHAAAQWSANENSQARGAEQPSKMAEAQTRQATSETSLAPQQFGRSTLSDYSSEHLSYGGADMIDGLIPRILQIDYTMIPRPSYQPLDCKLSSAAQEESKE